MLGGPENHTLFVTYSILVVLLMILWVLYTGINDSIMNKHANAMG